MSRAPVLRAVRVALDPTPAQERALARHAGAARKAYNEALAHVVRCLEQRAAELTYGIPTSQLTEVPWTLPALRRWWNQNKDRLAPWWAEQSKECYNSGLDALARGLQNWSQSRAGTRRGRRVGFPRFKSRRRSKPSFRYTTGSFGPAGRCRVQLPRIGVVKTHEQLDRLAGGRVLALTVSYDGRRWYCSFTVEAASAPQRPAHAAADRAHPVVGVDAGVRDLLVVAAPDGTEVARVPAPRSLAGVQARLRGLQRRAARQVGPDRRSGRGPSRRWQRTQRRIGRAHARAASVRRDVLHKATTALAERHRVIVVEDLAVQNMTRRKPGAGRGGRGLNRALADAALGEVRRQITYKCSWYGVTLVVADRWYPSSKTCSVCGRRKPSLPLAERTYTCTGCGLDRDRDLNAATNLARLGEAALTGSETGPAGSGPAAGRGANQKTDGHQQSAAGAGGDEASTPQDQPIHQTGTADPQGEAA